MSWQNDLYQRLRDREWHTAGVLFDQIEQDIPLHHAMRRYLGTGRNREIPPNTVARWVSYKAALSAIGYETDTGKKRNLLYADQIRLSYVEGEQCPICDGPVIKKNWSIGNRKFVCLACENPKLDLDLDLQVVFEPEVCGFPIRLWPHLWWQAERYFLEDKLHFDYDLYLHHITIKPADIVDLPCLITVPDDLISFAMPELGKWLSIDVKLVFPPIKHKRKRKRRVKTYPLPRPTIAPVAPPVLVKAPPKPIRPPRPESKPRPILTPISNVQPAQKEVVSITVDQIWKEFLQDVAGRIPRFNDNPKLRRMLHRALEAGICDEYTQATQGTFNELTTLGLNVVLTDNGKRVTIINPVDLTHAGKVIATRGGAWINATCMEHVRRRWGNALIHAYSFGATGLLVVLLQDKLPLMKKEIEHLIVANQPKIRPSNGSPPKPVKQKWVAPFKHARNMLQRWVNR